MHGRQYLGKNIIAGNSTKEGHIAWALLHGFECETRPLRVWSQCSGHSDQPGWDSSSSHTLTLSCVWQQHALPRQHTLPQTAVDNY